MKYLIIGVIMAGVSICGAETPQLKHVEVTAVRAPLPPASAPQPITNQLRAVITLPQPTNLTLSAQATDLRFAIPRVTNLPPGLVKNITTPTLKPSLRAGQPSPPVGIPNRPSLDMQTAIQRFQTFFNNTHYKDSHYIYSVYCQPSSGSTGWVYSVNVSPLIYKEVESSRSGYREILTTGFLVDMKGEVSMIETPSWFPKQSE
ncbi:MAG: hypothetical protein WC334_03270 [Kiritimatiellales bacterium]|jgi:hypothetical protein